MLKVLAETEEILALDKPAGLIVHRDGRTEEPSVAEWLAKEYPALKGIGGTWVSPQGENIDLNGIVHRLDRTTSGVLLVAKNPEMYAYIKRELKARRVEKVYRAYVYGHMEGTEGKIVAEIMRSSEPPRRWYARACEKSDKRAAITEWKLLERLKDPASYVEVRPKTGRTHQIRVHLAARGWPLVGDPTYGEPRWSEVTDPALAARLRRFPRQALHAWRLAVTHPITRERLRIEAPVPEDLKDLLEALNLSDFRF